MAAGEFPVHGLLERVVGRDVRLVRLVGRTSAARELANQTAVPAHHERARVTVVGELGVIARRRVVAANDEFERLLGDVVFGVLASDGLEAVDAPKRSAGGASVLDGEQCPHVVDVEVLRVAQLSLGDVVLEREEHILGRVETATIVDLREHIVGPVDIGLVPTCIRKERTVSQKREKKKEKKRKEEKREKKATYRRTACYP